MYGININDKKQGFTCQILQGLKTIETRKKPTLRPYINKKVGIVQTGKGKATCRFYCTIAKEIEYPNKTAFKRDYKLHRVSSKSNYFPQQFPCYGYLITDIEKIKPFKVNSLGIIARKI